MGVWGGGLGWGFGVGGGLRSGGWGGFELHPQAVPAHVPSKPPCMKVCKRGGGVAGCGSSFELF